MYMFVHTNTHAHTGTHAHTFAHTNTHTNSNMHTHIPTYTCPILGFKSISVLCGTSAEVAERHTNIYEHKHTYKCIYAYMYMYII